MYFSFLVFKTSEKYKFGGLYIKIFEKFEFRKKKRGRLLMFWIGECAILNDF